MENFPWWTILLIGLVFGAFIGFLIGFAAMQKLDEYEEKANKK
jgi:uncharacterized membrane-anchored protein YhcB (DUF1043 family)